MPCWDGLTRLEEGGLSFAKLFNMQTQHYVRIEVLLCLWKGYFTCFCRVRSEEKDNEGQHKEAESLNGAQNPGILGPGLTTGWNSKIRPYVFMKYVVLLSFVT